ncbi:hypothetical protein J3R30DRAFT_583752 [Lentinula aciculospora]|uniref:F-box domain-containing protein n=1 Tax=Lentinula aciculospora TaxID=153920 RepID=A0A9W9A6N3_9AGAR|nr:hypothetical protein J3R30DRAFT_583752 [Lentinula aciculospora]
MSVISTSNRYISWSKFLLDTPPKLPKDGCAAPKLPPEIFDLVIDCLQFSPPTLKACCLVARSWNAHCKPYLFRTVSLDVQSFPPATLPIRKRTFVRRLEGISGRDYLAQFTKRVRIETTSSRVGNKVTPHLMYQILANIPSFTNLYSLTLNVPWNLRWGVSSEWPTETLKSSLSNLIRQNPNLNSLSLSNPMFGSLNDLLAVMGFYSLNLEHLTIENIQNLPEDMREMDSDEIALWMKETIARREPRRFPLRSLCVGYMDSQIRSEILMYPGLIDWKEIMELNLSWDIHHSSSCSALLYCCLLDNLETLMLTIIYYPDVLLLNIQPNQVPRLNCLHVFSDSVDVIATILEKIIPASPLLQRIEVILDWAVPGVKKIHCSRTNSPVISRLDPLLAHHMTDEYECFRFVYVDIYTLYRKLSLKELQKLFRVLLPKSSQKTAFHFGRCHGDFHYKCRGTIGFY